ncbi:MAG: type II toxin-antitoxin system VapC family toxin [Acaryochloridaceae cyanobacterium RL_2_7]|nr:type II toxin-antitoxin system VapC family toxin [Acaryochloridaceae cyanobacterium RL_2_7]
MTQVFADTNLFLRYFTNDVPEQADQVDGLLQAAKNREIQLVTTAMVIAEVVWTLNSFYKLSREDIRDRVLAIVNTPGLLVADANLLVEAAINYVNKNVDFIDAYNVAWMKKSKVEKACTFDRKHFLRFDEITVVSPDEI